MSLADRSPWPRAGTGVAAHRLGGLPETATWWLGLPVRLRSWSAGDRRAMAEMVTVYVVAELGVRLVSLPRLARWLGIELALDGQPPAPRGSSLRLAPSERRRLIMAQKVANRWPWGAGQCLRVSLVSGWVLRRHGPRLRLGVQSTREAQLLGHAWVEIGGMAVTDPGDPALLPLVVRMPFPGLSDLCLPANRPATTARCNDTVRRNDTVPCNDTVRNDTVRRND